MHYYRTFVSWQRPYCKYRSVQVFPARWYTGRHGLPDANLAARNSGMSATWNAPQYLLVIRRILHFDQIIIEITDNLSQNLSVQIVMSYVGFSGFTLHFLCPLIDKGALSCPKYYALLQTSAPFIMSGSMSWHPTWKTQMPMATYTLPGTLNGRVCAVRNGSVNVSAQTCSNSKVPW